ncbi:hypothetical protein EBT25_12155, partial [bacterium]|nr:hypothetical protein [bacterium]
ARVSFGYNTNWFNDPTVTYSTSKKSTNTTFMLYSPNTGAPMTLKYANASTNLAVSYYNPYVYSSLNTFSTAFTTLTGGQAYVYHWTADSEF